MPSVTRKSQSSRAQRRDEITARLLTVVERLLEDGELSYTELSVERLVGEAEISRSTFYVYFEDKGDLLLALTAGMIDDVIAAAQHWWALPPDATKDDVRDALTRIFDAYAPHRVAMAAVVEAAAYDVAVRDAFAGHVQRTITAVAKHIRASQKQGGVRAGIDPKRTAAWLTWMTERGFYQLVGPAENAKRADLLQGLTDIVWNSLYAGTR